MGIVIVGGGFSGTMTAVHLARLGLRDIALLERREQPGQGVAYGTSLPCHLLNVPAGKMSALAAEPGHFVAWLRANSPEHADSSAFVPRPVYARYLQSLLQSHPAIRILRDEAVAIQRTDSGLLVETRGGDALPADRVVLALGNFPPANPRVSTPGFYSSRRYVAWAWAPHTYEGLEPADAVLLIGSGLTMIDKALALLHRGHRGPIHVISRRGLSPIRHAPAAPWDTLRGPAPREAKALLKLVRAEVRAARAKGVDWRGVIDGMRPHTQAIWRAMPLAEQRRFLRHLRHFWDVHRHRVAPEVADQLEGAIERGAIRVHIGKLEGFHEDDSGVDALLTTANGRERIRVQRVVNCTGPESNYRNLHHPLVANLLEQGLIRTDALALGLDAGDDGALYGSDGKAEGRLFTLGPPLKGKLWETTAVPELRVQAEALARRIRNAGA